jgi:hypothetical protein
VLLVVVVGPVPSGRRVLIGPVWSSPGEGNSLCASPLSDLRGRLAGRSPGRRPGRRAGRLPGRFAGRFVRREDVPLTCKVQGSGGADYFPTTPSGRPRPTRYWSQ